MPRGRPPNINRTAARDAGDKTYIDSGNPCWCGEDVKYTSNAQCVRCTIAKGKARYAAMTLDQLAELKAKDRARYEARLAANNAPTRRS